MGLSEFWNVEINSPPPNLRWEWLGFLVISNPFHQFCICKLFWRIIDNAFIIIVSSHRWIDVEWVLETECVKFWWKILWGLWKWCNCTNLMDSPTTHVCQKIFNSIFSNAIIGLLVVLRFLHYHLWANSFLVVIFSALV